MRVLKKAFATLLFMLLLLRPQSTSDLVLRPIYSASLKYEPTSRTISGEMYYKLPAGNYNEIVFNLWVNAFTLGKEGNFVFRDFYDQVFYQGDSRAELKIGNVRVNGITANFIINDTALIVTPSQPIPHDSVVELDMSYSFRIPAIGHRVGANTYAAWAGNFMPVLAVFQNNHWLTYPYYAAGDPFYSQNADFYVNITVPQGYDVIAPGHVQHGEAIAISAQNVRDFALVISDKYSKTTRISRQGIELSLYTRGIPTITINRLLDDLEDMIDFFSAEVGPYPYPKLTLTQITWFLGGMEYPGLIYLSEKTLQNYYSARSTMLHELAHQWFYAIIGNNQVEEAWIDEGLATFFQNRYLYGQELDSYYLQEKAALAKLLANTKDSRLGQPLSIYDDWTSYHRVNYRRGSLLQYELFTLMGRDKYRCFTQSLYDEFKHKELDRHSLIKLASEAYGSDLESWFTPWFND